MSKRMSKGPEWAKAPFPWFGGKRDAAETVWRALGDCHHYVEPFAGSLAVLLRRPHEPNRAYYSETVNDLDMHLTNFWRAVAHCPDEVAEHAAYPVSEVDVLSRHMHLVRWATDAGVRNKIITDPDAYYAREAGWWVWGICCWIGGEWCSGDGPWRVDDSGNLECQPRQRKGARAPGVDSKRPHLGNDGQGINSQTLRAPGVSSQLPHLASNGQGINSAALRAPGVSSKLPHLGDNGRGINSAALRAPGVKSSLPHLGNDGKGIHHATLREPGVSSQLPHLGSNGQGINSAALREPGVDYHPMTMPKAREWMRWLSARLRHVRILCGDWDRAVTSGASLTLSVRKGGGVCGVFLDPPYDMGVGRDSVYTHETDVSKDVREWCLKNGDNPKYRIVLAGFDVEHHGLESNGWRVVEWFKGGFLKGGMAQQGDRGHQQHRERLWLSPHCLSLDDGETGEKAGEQLMIHSEVTNEEDD